MSFVNGLLMFVLLLTALVLIVLVLIQRGKGGGLAGAFGGMGGQSAFGTKAGDLFTKITIGIAAFWIVLCALTVWQFGRGTDKGPLGEMGTGGEGNPVRRPQPRPANSRLPTRRKPPPRPRRRRPRGTSGQWSVASAKRRSCVESGKIDCTHWQLTSHWPLTERRPCCRA